MTANEFTYSTDLSWPPIRGAALLSFFTLWPTNDNSISGSDVQTRIASLIDFGLPFMPNLCDQPAGILIGQTFLKDDTDHSPTDHSSVHPRETNVNYKTLSDILICFKHFLVYLANIISNNQCLTHVFVYKK